jgi:trehalose-phosphatase
MRTLLRAAEKRRPLILFLDFDGTLVPLQADPESVRIPSDRRMILAALARRMPTAIISGRSLRDVQSRIAIKDVAWAGNHGLEVRQGRSLWLHPEAKRIVPILRKTLREAERRLKAVPGVRIEDKGLSASVHFRGAPVGAVSEIRRILRGLVPPGSDRLKITRGKKVFEIRPAVAWDKGRAALCLMKRLDPKGEATPVYLGDDRTDEDAFRALAGRGLAVLVGTARPTSAEYRLPDIDAVWRFLQALLLI